MAQSSARARALTAAQLNAWNGLDLGSRTLRFWAAPWIPCWMLRQAMAYTALAESDLNPTAVGDAGASVGLVQFYERTAGNLSVPWPWDWRTNPVASGWASVEYVAQAVKADPSWKPLLTDPDTDRRLATWRVLWRYNPHANRNLRQGRIAKEQAALKPSNVATATMLASSGPFAPSQPSNV